MKNKKILIISILILFVIPFINAADCEPGWICDGAGIEVYLSEGLFCPSPYIGWEDTSLVKFYPTTSREETDFEIYDCRDPEGGGSCCPGDCLSVIGTELEDMVNPLPNFPENVDSYACQATTKSHCSQYEDETSCEDESTIGKAKDSIENDPNYGVGWCSQTREFSKDSGEWCWEQHSCECMWNSDIDGATGAAIGCVAEASTFDECESGIVEPLTEECEYVINYDESLCDEPGGHIIATSTLVAGPIDCEPTNTYNLSCENITRLGFFTWINAIVVVIILVVIYYLLILKKKKRKKK